jgi:hypothetical protein
MKLQESMKLNIECNGEHVHNTLNNPRILRDIYGGLTN